MKTVLTVFKKNKKVFFVIGIIGLIMHIILFQSINSLMLLPFLLYWVILGIVYKLNERYFFAIALFFLILSLPLFLLGKFELAEKLSVWEFLFLIMGLLQWLVLEIPLLNRKK